MNQVLRTLIATVFLLAVFPQFGIASDEDGDNEIQIEMSIDDDGHLGHNPGPKRSSIRPVQCPCVVFYSETGRMLKFDNTAVETEVAYQVLNSESNVVKTGLLSGQSTHRVYVGDLEQGTYFIKIFVAGRLFIGMF